MPIDRGLDRPGLELNNPRRLDESPFGSSGPITPAPVGVAKTTVNGTAATSLTAEMPDDIVAGELLVVVCGGDYAASSAVFSTATTGWTRQLTQGNSTSDCYQGIFWKEAVGADADLVIDSTHSQRMVSIAFRVENADLTNPFMSQYAYTGSAARSFEELYPPRQIETHCMLLGSVSMDGSNRAPVNPSPYAQTNGWVSLADALSNPATTTGVGLSVSTCPSEELDEQIFMPVSKWGTLNKTATDSAMTVTAIIRAAGVDSSKTNLINYSRDLTNKITPDGLYESLWHTSSLSTATYDKPGLGGVANTATEILDGNASQQNYVKFSFYITNTWSLKRCVVRYIIAKEDTATCVPSLRLYASTSSTLNGSHYGTQLDTENGALFETNDGLTDSSAVIQEYPHDSDFWEIVIQGSFTQQYPTAAIYPDLYATFGGGASSAQILGPTVANVEMYLNCDKEDVLGKPARIRDPENDFQTGSDLVYDPWLGQGPTVLGGMKPPVRVNESDAWVSPGAGLDGFSRARPGMLRTPNFTDWAAIQTGQTDFTVHQQFNTIWRTGTNAWLGVRFASNAQDGWMVGINNVLANPTIVFQEVVANAFQAASKTYATGHAAHKDSFDLTVSTDSAGIYVTLIIAGVEYNTEYLTTDKNTNTYAAIGMYATGGTNYVMGCGPFTVESY